MKPHSLMGYWESPSTFIQVSPDPPTPAEAKPFHVYTRSGNLVSFSLLIFARDAAHAEARFWKGIQTMVDKCYTDGPSAIYHKGALERLRQLLQEGAVSVDPYDTALLAAKVNWASNGGVL